MFKRVCTGAGAGDGWTPRELRTSFVSLMSHQGVSIEEIARLAGYATTRTPEIVYRCKHGPSSPPAPRSWTSSSQEFSSPAPVREPPKTQTSQPPVPDYPTGTRYPRPAGDGHPAGPAGHHATDHPPVTTRQIAGDQGQKPGAQYVHARCLRSRPGSRQPRALAAAGATVPGALAARRCGKRHPQRGMVGIGNRDLVACTRVGSPSCHAAADAGGCSRHNRASARRCRGHQRQAPAAAPEPPAAGRLAAAAAAGPCRPGTSAVRPDTVTAVSRTCRIRQVYPGDLLA